MKMLVSKTYLLCLLSFVCFAEIDGVPKPYEKTLPQSKSLSSTSSNRSVHVSERSESKSTKRVIQIGWDYQVNAFAPNKHFQLLHQGSTNPKKSELQQQLQSSNSAHVHYFLTIIAVQESNYSEAAQHLEKALEQDLPYYTGLWQKEKELSLLRQSVYAEKINNHIKQLEVLWREAITLGLHVVYWVPGSDVDEAYGYPPALSYRAGIYIPNTNRFIPLGLPFANAVFIKFWHERNEVVVVMAEQYVGMNSLLGNVRLISVDALDGTLISQTDRVPQGYEGPAAIEIITPAIKCGIFQAA